MQLYPAQFWLVYVDGKITVEPNGYGAANIHLDIAWEIHNAVIFLDAGVEIRVYIERPFLGGTRRSTWDEIGKIPIHAYREGTFSNFSQGINLPAYQLITLDTKKTLRADAVWPGKYKIALEFYMAQAGKEAVRLSTGFMRGNPINGTFFNQFRNIARLEMHVNSGDTQLKSGKKHSFRIGNSNLCRYTYIGNSISLYKKQYGEKTQPFSVEHRYGFPLFSVTRDFQQKTDLHGKNFSLDEIATACRAQIEALFKTVDECSLFYHLSAPILSSEDDAVSSLKSIKRSLQMTKISRDTCLNALDNESYQSIVDGLLVPLKRGFPLGLRRDPNNIRNLADAAYYWYELGEIRAHTEPYKAMQDRMAALDLLVNACLRLKIMDTMLSENTREEFLFMINVVVNTYYDIDARNALDTVLVFSFLSDLLKVDYQSINNQRTQN